MRELNVPRFAMVIIFFAQFEKKIGYLFIVFGLIELLLIFPSHEFHFGLGLFIHSGLGLFTHFGPGLFIHSGLSLFQLLHILPCFKLHI